MAHTITYNSIDNMVEVKVQGDLTSNDVKDIALKVIRVSEEQKCRFILTDLREAIIQLTIIEIYELPKVFAAMAGLEIYNLKRAFVAAKGLQDLDFFETVTLNRAQKAKYFFDVDEARNWLSGK